MGYDFSNKKVWLTGASSGIGLALANKLLDNDAHVAVTARNEQRLVELFGNRKNAFVLPGDISSQSVNDEIISSIESKMGGLDCCIFNAGTAEYVDIQSFSAEPFSKMIEVNYLSMVKGISAALPLLRRSNSPYLVGMSSSVAWQGLPQGQAYSASKAAIRNLFQGLKIELAPENISVSWICPGFVKTPLTDKNTFDMPSRITVEESADAIYKGLAKKTTEIHFPKRFTLALKIISMLPAAWAAKLLKGTVPEK